LPERFDWVKFSFYRVHQKFVNKDTSYPMQIAYCFSGKNRYNDIAFIISLERNGEKHGPPVEKQ
ncbi:MAG: hypothetical protein II646_06495, partial [Firmicutes bacterium]|nr:hypothetical protein [Bacillota bacterium]